MSRPTQAHNLRSYVYESITLSPLPFHAVLLERMLLLGSFPFARRYLGNLYLISFPQGTEMFHFPWFALTPLDVSDITVGLPHSDTLGYYAPYQLT